MGTDAMRRAWPEVLDKVKSMRRVTWSFVSVNTKIVDFDGQRLLLQIATAGQAETFRRGNHAEVVRQALIEAIGVDTRVEAMVEGSGGSTPDQPRRGRTRSAEAPAPSSEPAPPAREPRRQRGGSPQPPPDRGWEHTGTANAPAWAQPTGEPADPAPRTGAPSRGHRDGSTGSEAPSAGPAGDIPSQDDDNLENSTTVGQPVIESVLGGKVIAIDDEPRG